MNYSLWTPFTLPLYNCSHIWGFHFLNAVSNISIPNDFFLQKSTYTVTQVKGSEHVKAFDVDRAYLSSRKVKPFSIPVSSVGFIPYYHRHKQASKQESKQTKNPVNGMCLGEHFDFYIYLY